MISESVDLKQERASIEVLQFYVAYYKKALSAQEELLGSKRIGPHERNLLETQSQLRNIATRKIFAIFGPLITNEIKAALSNSNIPTNSDVWSALQTSALEGMDRGLRKIDLSQTVSPTNYLMMWVSAYVTRERDRIEMPIDMSINLYRKFKKISAVRKKLSSQLGREASTSEILDYFHAGDADLKSMKGKKSGATQQKSNLNLRATDIEEQARFESTAMSVKVLDNMEEMSANSFAVNDGNTLRETLFGSFAEKYNLTSAAKAVIFSELNVGSIESKELETLRDLPKKDYNRILRLWRLMMKDPNGPFLSFLESVTDDGFEEFNVVETIKAIKASPAIKQDYSELFQGDIK